MASGKTGPLDIPGRHATQCFHPGAAAATATSSEPIFIAPCACRIKALSWVPSADVTGDNTDYFTLGIQNAGQAGAGTTALVTVKTYTTGVGETDFNESVFTLTTTEADLVLAEGDVVKAVRTKAGSGLIMPSGLFKIEFEPK